MNVMIWILNTYTHEMVHEKVSRHHFLAHLEIRPVSAFLQLRTSLLDLFLFHLKHHLMRIKPYKVNYEIS